MGNTTLCNTIAEEKLKYLDSAQVNGIVFQPNFTTDFQENIGEDQINFHSFTLTTCTHKVSKKVQQLKKQYKNRLEGSPFEEKCSNLFGFINTDIGYLDNMCQQVVFPYFESIQLFSQLETNRNLSHQSIIGIIYQILSLVRTLNKKGFMVRNLSPQSFLINPQTHKITLIDTDGIIEIQKTTKVVNSQILFSSPEQLNFGKEQTHTTDIWSIGIISFQMLTYKYPFKKMQTETSDMKKQIESLVPENLELSTHELQNKDILQFIKDCLNIDPKKRPEVELLMDQKLIKEQQISQINELIKTYSKTVVSLDRSQLYYHLIGQLFKFQDREKIQEIYSQTVVRFRSLTIEIFFKEIEKANMTLSDDQYSLLLILINDIKWITTEEEENIIGIETLSLLFFSFDRTHEQVIESFLLNYKLPHQTCDLEDLVKFYFIKADQITENINTYIQTSYKGKTKIDVLRMILVQMKQQSLKQLYNLKWFKIWFDRTIDPQDWETACRDSIKLFRFTTPKKTTLFENCKGIYLSERMEPFLDLFSFVYYIHQRQGSKQLQEQVTTTFSFGIMNQIQNQREKRQRRLQHDNIKSFMDNKSHSKPKAAYNGRNSRLIDDNIDPDDIKEKYNISDNELNSLLYHETIDKDQKDHHEMDSRPRVVDLHRYESEKTNTDVDDLQKMIQTDKNNGTSKENLEQYKEQVENLYNDYVPTHKMI